MSSGRASAEATIPVWPHAGARLVVVTAILWVATAWALVACIVHARERLTAQRRVGRVLHAERGPILACVLYAGFGVVALVVVLLCCLGLLMTGAWMIPEIGEPYVAAGALIILSVAAVILAQSQRGGACGTEGVRSGSWSHSYGALDEWRLTGDHLRFRRGAVWRAVSLPTSLHEDVRGRLEELAAGRESRFSK